MALDDQRRREAALDDQLRQLSGFDHGARVLTVPQRIYVESFLPRTGDLRS